jgi:UDP-N-acetylmuramoylalanine--D-glutamate ligase
MSKQIVILGGGESGTGAAILARRQGHAVFLSDIGLIPKNNRDLLDEHGIDYEEGRHSEETILQAEEIIKSPGIPDSTPMMVKVRDKQIPVISEIEFACRYTSAKLIGITGTNGKTTTTLLTHHLLSNGGLDAGIAGNVGDSFAKKVAEEKHDHYVLELSSFQLDGMKRAHINIAVLLNITPDHLNWYNHDMSRYVASKFRITRNMRKADTLIYNAMDDQIAGHMGSVTTRAKRVAFGLTSAENVSAYANSNYLMFREGQEWKRLSKKLVPLKGDHNMLNVMAAVLAARSAGLSWDTIREVLPSFKNVPHRMEWVAEINGVAFYNDSKATNVDAVKYALDSFDRPVIWIAGGVDKGNNYDQISDLVRQRVKALVALGADTKKIQTYFTPVLGDVNMTDSAFKAVEIAYNRAEKGDVVLLSPACASFDLFKNYEERGEKFKEAVFALKNKEENSMLLAL